MAFSLKILLKPDSFKFQRLDIIVCFLASRAKTKKAWSSSSRDQSPLAGFSEKGTRNLRMGGRGNSLWQAISGTASQEMRQLGRTLKQGRTSTGSGVPSRQSSERKYSRQEGQGRPQVRMCASGSRRDKHTQCEVIDPGSLCAPWTLRKWTSLNTSTVLCTMGRRIASVSLLSEASSEESVVTMSESPLRRKCIEMIAPMIIGMICGLRPLRSSNPSCNARHPTAMLWWSPLGR